MIGTLTGCLLGVVLGMRHALEPDHLIAVSTFFSEGKPSKGVHIGLLWGLGHSLALLAVGAVLAIVGSQMPRRVSDCLEIGVAVMLIGLGVRSVRRALRHGQIRAIRRHSHGEVDHAHASSVSHVHVGRLTFSRGPLAVGLVHGLAGSGWLTALVLASLPSVATRLIYIVLFGLGSAVGMALLSGLMAWPISSVDANGRVRQYISSVGGALSIVLGFAIGWPLVTQLF